MTDTKEIYIGEKLIIAFRSDWCRCDSNDMSMDWDHPDAMHDVFSCIDCRQLSGHRNSLVVPHSRRIIRIIWLRNRRYHTSGNFEPVMHTMHTTLFSMYFQFIPNSAHTPLCSSSGCFRHLLILSDDDLMLLDIDRITILAGVRGFRPTFRWYAWTLPMNVVNVIAAATCGAIFWSLATLDCCRILAAHLWNSQCAYLGRKSSFRQLSTFSNQRKYTNINI